jgi:ABC-type antimicrobial peptide transport system permease subunit
LRRNARHLILSSLGIVVGIGSFVFFVALGGGVKNIITHDLLGALPVNQIEVAPKRFDVGMTQQKSLFAMKFDDDMIERFLSIPEIRSVYPKMNLRAPVRAIIPIPASFQKHGMASAFHTELVIQGIDPLAIPSDEADPKEFKHKGTPSAQNPIPCLISTRLLDLYNATLADLRGFPKLNAQATRLVPIFEIIVGSSVFRSATHEKGERRYPSRIYGVSNRAILVGITIPIQYVKEINRIYNPDDKANTYQSAIIETYSPDQIPIVLKKLDSLGFALDSGQIFARKVGEIILLITVLLSMISAVIMLIAAISISHTFFMAIYERRYQIGLMRAVGATRNTIRILVMTESAIVGIVSGIAGVISTFALTKLLQWGLHQYHSLPFSAERLFVFPLWLPLLALGFAIIFCLVGAFFPARRAAALDPARVLNGS